MFSFSCWPFDKMCHLYFLYINGQFFLHQNDPHAPVNKFIKIPTKIYCRRFVHNVENLHKIHELTCSGIVTRIIIYNLFKLISQSNQVT